MSEIIFVNDLTPEKKRQLRERYQPPDRGAASLGQLDAHGLARLRQLILQVIDDGVDSTSGNWELYDADEVVANTQRLDFCDAVQAAIVKAAAPATAAKGVQQ